MNDGGVLDRLRRRWAGNNVPCEEPSPFTELDFTHTVTAFIILLLGIIFALVLACLERLCMRKKLRRSRASEGEVKAREAEAKRHARNRGRKRRWEDNSERPAVYTAFVDKQGSYSS